MAKIKKMLFFSIFIRSILIAYLSLCVTANFGAAFSEEPSGDPPNYPVICFLSLVISAGFFLANFVEKQELDRSSTQELFGSAYQGIKTRTTSTMNQVPLFFIRRLLFVMALQCRIFSVNYGGIINLVVFYLCFLLDKRPYESFAHMNLEIFNELFLLSSLYILPLFTDWVTEPKVQYVYGWVFVYTLAPLFMINISYVIMLAVEIVSLKFKKRTQVKLMNEKKVKNEASRIVKTAKKKTKPELWTR